MNVRKFTLLSVLVLSVSGFEAVQAEEPKQPASAAATSSNSMIERGRHLTIIAGCNDCHTSGFADKGGKVPEADWLQGDRIGWYGPWGTTYPINLRNYFAAIDESTWLVTARNLKSRPPMPTWALAAMSDEDLRALYHFIRHLGAKGEAVPGYIPPGTEPQLPYFKLHLPTAPAK